MEWRNSFALLSLLHERGKPIAREESDGAMLPDCIGSLAKTSAYPYTAIRASHCEVSALDIMADSKAQVTW